MQREGKADAANIEVGDHEDGVKKVLTMSASLDDTDVKITTALSPDAVAWLVTELQTPNQN